MKIVATLTLLALLAACENTDRTFARHDGGGTNKSTAVPSIPFMVDAPGKNEGSGKSDSMVEAPGKNSDSGFN